MNAAIRPARMSDLDDLVAIEQASFPGDRLSRRALRHLVGSPTASVLVADAPEGVAGYAVVLTRSTSPIARLYSLASRVRGVGHRLLAAAETEAARRGLRAMRLEVRNDNALAIRLYERAAYGRLGTRPDYYQDGMTALRMQKNFGARDAGTAAP